MRKMSTMQNGEAQGANGTETPASAPPGGADDASEAQGAEAAEVGGDVSGLKAKVAELLDLNRKLKDKESEREQAEALKRGDHEKVIADLKAQNESLKSVQDERNGYLKEELGELAKVIGKLPASQRKLFNLESLGDLQNVRRTRGIAEALLGQSPTDGKPAEAPPVSPPPDGKTNFEGLAGEELVEAIRGDQKGWVEHALAQVQGPMTSFQQRRALQKE